jgi:GntR family transcriptional regulator
MPRQTRGALADAAQPLWKQVADVLAGEVGGADVQPGQRLASEAALCRRFGVSRVTMRQALADVAARGLVHPKAGRGWFTGAGPEQPGRAVYEPPGMLVSFSEMARSRGLRPDSLVLSCDVLPADIGEAAALGIAPGAPLISLRRVRRLDGLPVALEHSRVPLALLPDAESVDFAHESLFDHLRRHGARPAHSNYELRAIAADDSVAELLDVALGAPLLAASESLFDQNGRTIELGRITNRGDRYLFRAVLHS